MNKIIKAYLLQHSKLVINGLGIFEIMYKSADIHPILHTFTAPGKYTVFTHDEKVNSDEFISYLSEKQNITKSEAVNKIKEWELDLKNSMKTEKTYSLGTLGTFSLDAIGNLIFIPSLDTDISPESYGLDDFTFPPSTVNKKEDTEVVNTEEVKHTPSTNKRRGKGAVVWYAFLIVFLVAIVGIGIYAALYTQEFIVIKDKAVSEICQRFTSNDKETLAIEPVKDTIPADEAIVEENIEKVPSQTNSVEENQNFPIEEVTVTTNTVAASGNTYIVLGSFKSEENAKTFLQQKQNEYPNALQLGQGNKSGLWMVGIGPYEKEEAQRFLKENKINGWILRK